MKRGRGSVGLVLLGLLALGLVALAFHHARPRGVRPLAIAVGSKVTSRALFAEALAARSGANVVEAPDTLRAIEDVEAGRIDAALVPGAIPLGHHPHLRQVAALQMEPLHLLVKSELAAEVTRDLGTLRGKVVNLGSPGRTEYHLARALLDFVDVPVQGADAPDGYVSRSLDPRELLVEAELPVPDQLPDAIFLLETLPSRVARALVVDRDYRLVPLAFAEAFALSSITQEVERRKAAEDGQDLETLHRGFVFDALIPAYTYDVDPPVPDQSIHTLGTRLLLIANAGVEPEAIERLLDVAFGTEFASELRWGLDSRLLHLAPEIPLHEGTRAWLQRDKPAITGNTVDAAANTLSVVGAMAGSLLFAWQWLRQRTRSRREETFEAYLVKVAAIERRAAELELGAQLDLEALLDLQRDVVRLKGEALDRFSSGELEGRELVSGFLTHANDTRDYLARLILHVRENLEEQAEAEGRSAGAVWKEALAAPDPATPEAADAPAESERR